MDIRYLTLSELIYINGVVLDKPDIASGKQQIRDIGLLDAAVARPAATAFGQDAYPTLRQKAAALFHSVARNHPFADGNKRTATVAVVYMFRVNGQAVVWTQDDALPIIVKAAEGQTDVETLAAWFPLAERPYSDEPDAERDKRLIAQIVTEQKGLLDELKRQ